LTASLVPDTNFHLPVFYLGTLK